MKTEKIVWGLILVFIGGILLLENFGIIDFHWSAIWHLWPLVLIIIGANMIVNRSHTTGGAVAGIAITVLVLGVVAYQGINGRTRYPHWFHYNFKGDNDDSDEDAVNYSKDGKWHNNAFSEPFVSTVKRARLEISGGATVYTIKDSSVNLIDVSARQQNSKYSLTKTSTDSTEVLKFSMRNGKHRFSFGDMDEAKLKLNANPIWDITVNMGAGESDFDLSKFKIENLRLKGGAASFQVKLGLPQSVTNITTETGMAEVKLSVPKEAACQIRVNSGISTRDFNGFDKQPDGTYTTSNFNSGAKKIIINLKGGLSDFEVSRY